MKRVLIFSLVIILTTALSCQHQPYVIPVEDRTGDPTLCFDRDILPIFLSQCAKSGCHDAAEHEKGYILDSYDNIIKKGIAPGNALGSTIYKSVAGYTEELMPEGAPPLTATQLDLLKRWIDAGAIKDANCTSSCDTNNFAYTAGVKPIIDQYCLGCHSGTSPQGNLLLNSYTAVKNAVLNRNLVNCINYTTGFFPMPQGLKLSDCEIRRVEKWVANGMPDN
jgi:mono/diheme cytochrome c family protein